MIYSEKQYKELEEKYKKELQKLKKSYNYGNFKLFAKQPGWQHSQL